MILKALSKPRSSKQHLIIHMKVILLAIIGVLLWQSDSARTFASDTLYKAAEIIEPDVSDRTIGETIDSFRTDLQTLDVSKLINLSFLCLHFHSLL